MSLLKLRARRIAGMQNPTAVIFLSTVRVSRPLSMCSPVLQSRRRIQLSVPLGPYYSDRSSPWHYEQDQEHLLSIRLLRPIQHGQ